MKLKVKQKVLQESPIGSLTLEIKGVIENLEFCKDEEGSNYPEEEQNYNKNNILDIGFWLIFRNNLSFIPKIFYADSVNNSLYFHHNSIIFNRKYKSHI